jgi:hypothetical protein
MSFPEVDVPVVSGTRMTSLVMSVLDVPSVTLAMVVFEKQ